MSLIMLRLLTFYLVLWSNLTRFCDFRALEQRQGKKNAGPDRTVRSHKTIIPETIHDLSLAVLEHEKCRQVGNSQLSAVPTCRREVPTTAHREGDIYQELKELNGPKCLFYYFYPPNNPHTYNLSLS